MNDQFGWEADIPLLCWALMIDWDEIGTLRHVEGNYLIREAPLWLLVATASQGHEGRPEELQITLASGANYRGDGIRELARRSDRRQT